MTDIVEQLKTLLGQMRIVDLSHTLEPNMPAWPTHPRYAHNLVESYALGDLACHYQLVLGEHTGTHMDAPLHFIQSGTAHYGIDQVSLESVAGRAATIVSVELGENGLLRREHVQAWESEHGAIESGDIVLIRFGWDDLWATRPAGAPFLSNWPGVGKDAAEYFVQKQVKAIGCDTLAIDAFDSTDFPAHYTLLSHEVLIIENLNNLDHLPPFSYFMGFPLKIQDGSGSPIRALGYVPA